MFPQPEAFIGKTLGGYHLTRIIGSGGAGTVYLGANDAGEQVAVKVMLPAMRVSPAEMEDISQRFRREAEVLERLRHPHILPVLAFDTDPESGNFYMIMPYMAGGTLADRLRQGPLPFDEVSRYITQLADALDYAHQQGVIHRDIKPSNVLLNDQGQAVLADFGIAKLVDSLGMTITTTGAILGTPEYMTLEQLQGQNAAITAATDVYGLGALAYHLLTDTKPYAAATPQAVIIAIAQFPPVAPSAVRHDLPAPAEAVIMKALARQPQDRFASTGAFAAALAEGLRGIWSAGISPTLPPTIAADVPPTVTAPLSVPPGGSYPSTHLNVRQPVATNFPGTGPLGQTGPVAPPQAPAYWATPGQAAPPAAPRRTSATSMRVGLVAAASILVLAAAFAGILAIFGRLGAATSSSSTTIGNQSSTTSSFATATIAPTTAPTQTAMPTATTAPTQTAMPTATTAPTQTAMPTATTAPTFTPTPTPTPTPTTQPQPFVYNASAPGPCDTNGASWSIQSVAGSNPSYTCNGATFSFSQFGNANYSVAEATFSPPNHALPAAYNVSVRISSVSAGIFVLRNSGYGYSGVICLDGTWILRKYAMNGAPIDLSSNNIGISSVYALELQVTSSTVALVINSATVFTAPRTSEYTGGYSSLAVYNTTPSSTGSANFAQFAYADAS